MSNAPFSGAANGTAGSHLNCASRPPLQRLVRPRLRFIMDSKKHDLSLRETLPNISPDSDSDLTVDVCDDGIHLFAEGPGGFHIPRKRAHFEAAEKHSAAL